MVEKQPHLVVDISPDNLRERLNNAQEKGAKISDILSSTAEEIELEIETRSGTIYLQNIRGSRRWRVIESEDTNRLNQGEIIILEGATLTGGTILPDVIGPEALTAFHRRRILLYKLGEKTEAGRERDLDTMSHERYEEMRQAGLASINDDGLVEVDSLDPQPSSTDVVTHLQKWEKTTPLNRNTPLF